MQSKIKLLKTKLEAVKVVKVHIQPNVVGFSVLNDLESKLREVERTHAELLAETTALRRIQND